MCVRERDLRSRHVDMSSLVRMFLYDVYYCIPYYLMFLCSGLVCGERVGRVTCKRWPPCQPE